jgi:glycosyltransferase involved in cell wall biosynthesis
MEIAGAIKALLDNPPKREELRRNAKLFVQHAFSPDRVSKQLIAEYRKILNREQ